MPMTYVFPDLHGRLDHFRAAVAAASSPSDDTFIFLGDYIDRGPESAQLVKELRELQEGRPNVICLSGNHEYMMLWGLTQGDEQLRGWMANGGRSTIDSYTDGLGNLDEEAMMQDCQWFSELPFFHEDDHRVYVHAGVIDGASLHEQSLERFHWSRYGEEDGTGWNGKHVVHGHTPDRDGPKTIGNRTACDVGAVWTGRYVVLVFSSYIPGGPVRVIEVHG